MEIEQRIEAVEKSLSKAYVDWQQRVAHPEEHESHGWGSSDVIARDRSSDKFCTVARVYDSNNLYALLSAMEHIGPIIDEIKRLRSR